MQKKKDHLLGPGFTHFTFLSLLFYTGSYALFHLIHEGHSVLREDCFFVFDYLHLYKVFMYKKIDIFLFFC